LILVVGDPTSMLFFFLLFLAVGDPTSMLLDTLRGAR
jgi:hypothetical protein